MLQTVITPLSSRHDTGTAQVGQLRFIRTVRTVWSWPEGLLMNPTLHFCLQAVQDQQVTMAFYLWRFNMPSWSAFSPALVWRMALPSGSTVPGSKRGLSYVSLAPTIGDVTHVFKPKWWFERNKKEKYEQDIKWGHFFLIYRWQKKMIIQNTAVYTSCNHIYKKFRIEGLVHECEIELNLPYSTGRWTRKTGSTRYS